MDTFDTIIGQNVKLQGNVTNQGSIQINGIVEGQIESGSAVIIGNNATVRGPIKAKVVEIAGEVYGSVHAEDRIEIMTKGKLYGDCTTKNLVIKLGAVFVGKSEYIKEAKPDESVASAQK